MNTETPALVRALLNDSLVVWKVRGEVTSGEPPADAVVHAEAGTVVSVEQAPASDAPIRWWVRWHSPGSVPRSRPCTSVVGLLRTVRDALGAEPGYRVRIAPLPGRT